jgi:hypothetical protein
LVHELIDLGDQASRAALPPRMQALSSEAGEIWDRCQAKREFRVITIMASSLGFDACGIEIESQLVNLARGLAEKYGPQARFATGNFIPDDYEWSPEYGDGDFRTASEATSGYEELDMELRDFDLVYAYPWPDEQPMYRDIMQQCGGRNSLYLGYDAREGTILSRLGRCP